MRKTITPVLTSILDNDFYKFTMQCAVVKVFPNVETQNEFINRGHHEFPPGFADALREQVGLMAKLALSAEERAFLTTQCPYLNPA